MFGQRVSFAWINLYSYAIHFLSNINVIPARTVLYCACDKLGINYTCLILL